MLIAIKDWILKNSGHKVEENFGEYTSSLVVNYESEHKIARFTAWDDNSCVLEIMNVETGAYILNERLEFSEVMEAIKAFRKFDGLLN